MQTGIADAREAPPRTTRRNARWHTVGIFAVLAFAYAAAGVGYVVWRMLKYRLPYPYWDSVAVDLFVGERFLPGWGLQTALQFTVNEHRPIFPLYIYAADHSWFASDGAAIIALNALLLLFVALLIAAWMRGSGPLTIQRVVLMAAAPVAVFWPAQAQNLNWLMQVNFILSTAALLAAIPLLLLAERVATIRPGAAIGWTVAAAICLFVSSFSLAFGILGWPILLAYLLCRRAPWRVIVPFAAAGAGTILLYASTWSPIAHHADPFAALLQPVAVGRYMFAMLGAPLHYLLDYPFFHPPAWLRQLFGGIVFVSIVAASLRVFFERASRRTPATVGERGLVIMALLAAACAFITALGRHNFGADQALSSRYVLFGVLAWLGVAGYWVPRLRFAPAGAGLGYAAIALLLVAFTTSYLYRATELRVIAAGVRVAAAAATHDIDDPAMYPRLYPSHQQDTKLARLNDSLRRRGHPFFAEPWHAWYGRNAIELFSNADARRCSGHVDATTRFGAKVRRQNGWAWDHDRKAPPPYVVALDGAGTVRGVGFNGFPRLDLVRLLGRPRYFHAGWMLLAGTDAERPTVLAVTHDGKSCVLGPLRPARS
ncbi:MAG: hypothetical protein AB7G15_02050 [Alphaproteobacteria bacterium]